MEKQTDQRPIPTNQARQAVTGHNVRYVLLFGILGLVVAYLIVVALGLA